MAVTLHNPAHVDETLVRRVIAASEVPAGRILVVLYEKGGLRIRGFATPRPLLKYAGRFEDMFYLFPNEWEHAVVMLKEAFAYLHDHPAYFALLLEHELEHVRVGAADICDAVLARLIHNNIHEASSGAVTVYQETPEEVQCDKAGKRLAVELFGEDGFRQCMEELEAAAEAAGEEDKVVRFRYLRELEATASEMPLRKRLLEYVKPNGDELAEIWKRQAAEDPDCMAALIPDPGKVLRGEE